MIKVIIKATSSDLIIVAVNSHRHHSPLTKTVNLNGGGVNFGNQQSQETVFLPLDEEAASRAVFVIASGADGRTDGRTGGNAFGAS